MKKLKTPEIRGEEPNVRARNPWGVLHNHRCIIRFWQKNGMFYKQKLKHSCHFFANAHEISYKSNIIRRNGYTWKYLRKMRKGNKLKKRRKIWSENISKDKP